MAIYRVNARETIASVSSSTGFTSTQLTSEVQYAIIQALSGNIRFCIDGSTPSTSLGIRLLQNSTVEIWGKQAMTDFRCIDDGGTATLEVVYMSWR